MIWDFLYRMEFKEALYRLKQARLLSPAIDEERERADLRLLEKNEYAWPSYLVELGWIDYNRLRQWMEEQIGLEILSWDPSQPIEPNLADSQSIGLSYCKEKRFVLARRGEDLLILMANPTDDRVISQVRFYFEEEVLIYFVFDSWLNDWFNKIEEKNVLVGDSVKVFRESEVIGVVDEMIETAMRRSVSDIHVEVLAQNGRIRFRQDGVLTVYRDDIKKQDMPAIIARLKILAGLDISEKRLPQDGRIVKNQTDIRVSIIPGIEGEQAVLRILDKSHIDLSIGSIFYNKKDLAIIKRAIARTQGLILISGPTGSGKTTTLYSMLLAIHSPQVKILTIEDPIEYRLDGILQVPARPEIGFHFADGLRSFLRHDPDVIMVGEIRDQETAEIAIRASLTGHLVLSTIHTNHSVAVITRLIDMGIPRYLLSATLSLAISQRLLRKLCDRCKKKSHAKNPLKIPNHYTAGKCPSCNQTGYHGRIPIFEILEIDDAIARSIHDGKGEKEIQMLLKRRGFQTLKEKAMGLIQKGITSIEEYQRVLASY